MNERPYLNARIKASLSTRAHWTCRDVNEQKKNVLKIQAIVDDREAGFYRRSLDPLHPENSCLIISLDLD
jgi:hypothetical protein